MIVQLFLFQTGGGGFTFLLPMILVFGVFYLLLIRPQQKKQRELQSTIAQLKAGDRVITTGGVVGKITEVRDTSFLIRSADKTILEIARTAVAGVDSEEAK
jgi:preprotein translocase subunit YajC